MSGVFLLLAETCGGLHTTPFILLAASVPDGIGQSADAARRAVAPRRAAGAPLSGRSRPAKIIQEVEGRPSSLCEADRHCKGWVCCVQFSFDLSGEYSGEGRATMMQAKNVIFLPAVVAAWLLIHGAPSLAACPHFLPEPSQPIGGPLGFMVLDEFTKVPAPARHLPFPTGSLDSAKFVLSRGSCLGTCPSYTVTVHGNGLVVYEGKNYVLVKGKHVTRVSTSAVGCLLKAFQAADFWSLSSRYSAPITDLPEYEMKLTIGGQTKTLEDYAGELVGMPREVSALEDAIDAVAADAKWVIGDNTTISALEAEGWDFHSAATGEILARASATAPESLVLGLIERGAPLRGKVQSFGAPDSAVENAALHRRLNILRALISAGAFKVGGQLAINNALRASVGSSRPEVVREVLMHGPDVNSRDAQGDTSLMLVMTGTHPNSDEGGFAKGNTEIIRLLLQAGANPDLPNNEGRTPLHETLDADEARELIRGGASLEARDNEGNTPLHETFDEDVAVALINAGADSSEFGERAREKGWTKALQAMKDREK